MCVFYSADADAFRKEVKKVSSFFPNQVSGPFFPTVDDLLCMTASLSRQKSSRHDTRRGLRFFCALYEHLLVSRAKNQFQPRVY